MGNDIKNLSTSIGQKINQFDMTPKNNIDGIPTNHIQNIEDAIKLNNLLLKNIYNLGVKLQLEPNSFTKIGQKWENHIMRGTISTELPKRYQDLQQKKESEMNIKQETTKIEKINHKEQKQQLQQNKTQQKQQKQVNNQQEREQIPIQKKKKMIQYGIIMTLTEIYEMKRLLQNYQQEQQQLMKKRRQSDGKLCVICLQNKIEQVLPCAHSYCRPCMSKYVIDKDKKCPMCRKSYQQSLVQNIFQIVQWDDDFVIEMRNIFFKILEKHNPREVRKIKQILQEKQKIENENKKYLQE